MSINKSILVNPKEGDIYYDGRYNYIYELNKWYKLKLSPARRRINKIKNLYELR
jgi:hypothetical protein